MRKNAGSRAVSTNLDNLLIAIILIIIFCLGFLNFLTKFNIVYPTIEASSEFNNYNVNNTNFGVNQTYPSEIIIDTYYQVKIGDIIKPVMISSYGNKVSGLSYDDEENSIILLLNPLTSKGNNMRIDIPRDILDSKLNGNDKNFTVMIDDNPAKFLEITNNSKVNSVSNRHLDNISKIQYSNNTDTRKLMIEYGADSKIIKISGTDTNNLPKESISTMKDNPRLYLPIKINNTIKYLPAELKGGLLNSSELVINSQINRSLFLSILPHSNYGNMRIDIPRDILDSKLNGNDKNFTVMIDDNPAKFLEITNNSKVNSVSNRHLDNISKIQYSNNTDTRKLMIEYGADSKIIKISGTDTNNLSNKSQGIDIERDKTTKDRYGQQDIFFPIIYIIMTAAGIAIFYLLYRKNKNLLMRKTRSR